MVLIFALVFKCQNFFYIFSVTEKLHDDGPCWLRISTLYYACTAKISIEYIESQRIPSVFCGFFVFLFLSNLVLVDPLSGHVCVVGHCHL